MAYFVSITPRGERDFANLYEHINAEHSNVALKRNCGTSYTAASRTSTA